MNKIFKVVWSKIKHCYVVVSEIAKNTTSGGARRCRMGKVSLAAAMAAAVLTGSFAVPNSAWAADGQATYDVYAAFRLQSWEVDVRPKPDDCHEEYVYKDKKDGTHKVATSASGLGQRFSDYSVYYVKNGYSITRLNEKGDVVEVSGSPASGNVKVLAATQTRVENIGDNNQPVTTRRGDLLTVNIAQSFASATNGGNTSPPAQLKELGSTENNLYGYIIYNSSGVPVTDAQYEQNGSNGRLVKLAEENGKYYYVKDKNTKIEVATKNVYFLRDYYGENDKTEYKVQAYTFLNDLGEVYNGVVYGVNSERLATTKAEDGNIYTFWAVEASDEYTTLDKMTVNDLNESFNTIAEDLVALQKADFNSISLTPASDNSSNNVIDFKDFAGDTIDSINVSVAGGTSDSSGNRKVLFRNGNERFELETGSIVSANEEDGWQEGISLKDITINGKKYTIAAPNTVEDGNDYINNITAGKDDSGKINTTYSYSTEGKESISGISFVAGENVSLGLGNDNRTITINATDYHLVGATEKNENGKYTYSGEYSVDIEGKLVLNVQNGTDQVADKDKITITGLVTKSALEQVQQTANAGWNLKVGNETDAYNVKPEQDTVTLKATNGSDDINNLTIAREGGVVTYSFTDKPNFTSVKVGNDVVIDGTGIVIHNDTNDNKDVVFSKTNISVGGNQIHNVAAGTVDTDAVNMSQLKAVSATVNKGWNLNVVTDTNTNTYNVVPDGSVTLQSANNNNLQITNNNGVVTFTAKDDFISTASFNANNGTLTLGYNDNSKTALSVAGLMSGWTAQVGTETLTVDNKKVIEYVAGDNIVLDIDGNDIKVATAKEVAFDKVTVGNSDTVTNNIVISNTGIAMGNKSIGGLLGQDIVQGSTYAVTGSQLWNAMQQDIHSIKVTGGVNSGTVSLLRNALDSTGNNIIVKQPLTVSSSGGSGQDHPDTKITISDGTQTITLDTGSKVIGINNKDNALNDYHWNGTIEAIAINGMAYELGGISSGAYAEHDYHLVMEGSDGVNLSAKYGSGYADNAQAYKADGNGVVTLDVQNSHDSNETGTYPARHVYIDDVASKEVLDGVSAQVEQNTKDIVKVNNRVSDVDNRVTQVDNRVSNLDSRVEQVNNRVSDVDNRVTQVDNRVSNLDSRVEQVNNRVSDVDNRVTQIDYRVSNLDSRVEQVNNRVSDVEQQVVQVNNRVSDVEQQVVQVNNRVSDVEQQVVQVNNRVTEVESNFITQGNIVEEDGSIELKNSKGDVKATVEGLSDYAIEARNDYKVNDGKVTLKIKDRFGGEDKEAVIHDVASATDLSNLTDAVGVATKESLKDSYKVTTYLKDKVEDGTVTEKGAESLVEADVKLDKAIKDNADLSYQNDVVLQNQIQNQTAYLDSRINQLGSKVNKVGAGAAALAALHPMDFDPDDKLSFAVGAGNYAGETATALGAFYRPNEKVMMNVAGTYGNGENMVNMGVSFALDRTNNISNSRTAMAREIVDLREQVATQGQQIAQLVALVNQLSGVKEPVAPTVQPFPDVPANHWAYEYLNNLVAMGVIEGYPDGTFGGDRTMTRYEFATMLFKAMQNGAVLSEQIRQEFNAELGRVRVDRIKGADDDANKIERVRVNNYEDRDDYGSKIVMVSAGK